MAVRDHAALCRGSRRVGVVGGVSEGIGRGILVRLGRRLIHRLARGAGQGLRSIGIRVQGRCRSALSLVVSLGRCSRRRGSIVDGLRRRATHGIESGRRVLLLLRLLLLLVLAWVRWRRSRIGASRWRLLLLLLLLLKIMGRWNLLASGYRSLRWIVAVRHVAVDGTRARRRVSIISHGWSSGGWLPMHSRRARHGRHCLSAAFLGHRRGYRGRGHGLGSARRRIRTEDVGKGSVSLVVGMAAVLIRARRRHAVMLLVIGHDGGTGGTTTSTTANLRPPRLSTLLFFAPRAIRKSQVRPILERLGR